MSVSTKKLGLNLLALTLLSSSAAFARTGSQSAVLQKTVERVESAIAAGEEPVVIFDLDDTLFDSRSRKIAVLRAFARQAEIQEEFPIEASRLLELTLKDIHYGLNSTLEEAGITSPEFVAAAHKYFTAHFFFILSVLIDLNIAGVLEFVY